MKEQTITLTLKSIGIDPISVDIGVLFEDMTGDIKVIDAFPKSTANEWITPYLKSVDLAVMVNNTRPTYKASRVPAFLVKEVA